MGATRRRLRDRGHPRTVKLTDALIAATAIEQVSLSSRTVTTTTRLRALVPPYP